MSTFRFVSRRAFGATLGTAALAMSALAPAPAVAAGAYSVIAGPRYSVSGALSNSHKLDCSIANPYFDNSACSLFIDTESAGCIWEKQSTDATATLPGNGTCRVVISGPVPFRSVSAYCVLGTTLPSLHVSYTVGTQPGRSMSPFEFYAVATFAPKAFNANATATKQYQMTIKAATTATATGQSVPAAVAKFSEVFTVDFAVPVADSCPNVDSNRTPIGNVKDARRDVVAQDNATTGFVKIDVATV